MTDHKHSPEAETVLPAPAPALAGQLSDSDLDAVSGGLNPQPLPPIQRRLS